ncbi:MAG: glycosyltransferase family 4 protein [Lentisphaerae bacterium]|nr:glycosyltransferase family 4 protein [Lentisphaerota bacterium]
MSGLVAVSEELLRQVESRYPSRTKLSVIPSGVPVPPEVCDPNGTIRMAYVGSLDQKRKRILDTAQAMGRVLGKYPDATAHFYGDGFERDELEEQIRQQPYADRMRVEGMIPCDRIQDRLKDHNVIVLLSEAEGTPGALMDGMACGLVPVCLDIEGGLRELVVHEKTGLVVEDRNESFAAALDLLHEDSALRSRISVAAREHIIARYALRECAAKWEAFCNDLLTKPERRRPRRISIPLRFRLPPPVSAFSREDRRKVFSWKVLGEELCLLPWTVKQRVIRLLRTS